MQKQEGTPGASTDPLRDRIAALAGEEAAQAELVDFLERWATRLALRLEVRSPGGRRLWHSGPEEPLECQRVEEVIRYSTGLSIRRVAHGEGASD